MIYCLSMVIGGLRLEGKAVLAPMAGLTDAPFRRLCRAFGAALVFTEMVSVHGLVRGNQRSKEHLRFGDEERPIGVQLFGADPGAVAEAVAIVADFRPEVIDLNFGCPVPKVVRQGAGAALLKDPARIAALCRAAVDASPVPVTAKVRSGWHDDADAVLLARVLVDSGVAAITVHARTRSAMFKHKADWKVIARVKEAVTVPVIGNGDVVDGASARRMMEETGCDAVMVGRGALGNPFIFRQINRALAGDEEGPPISATERFQAFLDHLALAVAYRPEQVAIVRMRQHLGWYLKRVSGTKKLRSEVMRMRSAAEVRAALLAWLAEREHASRPLSKRGE